MSEDSATPVPTRMSQRRSMDVFKIAQALKKLAADEKRSAEPSDASRRNTSRSSLSGMSTIGRRRGESTASEEDSILHTETLSKQGGRVKSWHRRFFVLHRTGGIKYFRDEDAYWGGQDPLGRIPFTDMMDFKDKDTVAQELPRSIYSMLGMRNVFAIHTESRTFMVSAPSKQSQQIWTQAINKGWLNFQKQRRRKDLMFMDIWRVGDDKVIELAKDLRRGNTDAEDVIEQMKDAISDAFAEQVKERYYRRTLASVFYAWKAVHYYRRTLAATTAAEAPAPTPAQRNASFWLPSTVYKRSSRRSSGMNSLHYSSTSSSLQ